MNQQNDYDGYENLYILIGNRVRQCRIERGLTQQNVADATGLSRTSLTNIERGFQRLTIHSLYIISAVLRTHPYDLLPPFDMPDMPVHTDELRSAQKQLDELENEFRELNRQKIELRKRLRKL